MTRKFAWWGAYGLAATALLASGANAEAVRLTASQDDLGWQDIDGRVRPSPVYFNEDPPPPPPKLKPRQGIGAGADSLSSPSDVQPMPKSAPAVEGPVQGIGPVQGGPYQKEGYGPVQSGPAQNGAIQNGYASPFQKSGEGYYGPSCGVGDAGCGVNYAPDCGYDSGPSCGYAAPSCGHDSAPSCGYDNSCYGDCFCPSTCCSRWWFRAEALIWDRSDASNQTIATSPGGALLAQNYNFDAQAGPRLSLFYRGFMDTCWDLEMTYFGIHGYEETQTLAGTTVIVTTPVIGIGGGATLDSTYHSRIDSSEVNLRRKISRWVTFLAGVRWIEEAEILNNDVAAANHNINVNNHLYGAQLGFDAMLWNRGGPWSVEGLAKAGVYYVDSDATTTISGVGGALPLITAGNTDTAFTADLGVTGVYQLTSYADFRIGYNLFWIDGIADAPSQMTTTNITTGVATVEQSNTQFYHGVSIGVQIRR